MIQDKFWLLMMLLPVVFGRTEPLGHDVGVGQGTVRHRREEEHGDGGEAVHVHLVTQALEQVVKDAAGVARHQHVTRGLQRVAHYPTKLPDNRVGHLELEQVSVIPALSTTPDPHLGWRVGEGGHDHDVRPLDADLVHGLGVGGQGGAARHVHHLEMNQILIILCQR